MCCLVSTLRNGYSSVERFKIICLVGSVKFESHV